jgi:hypothetical protein
LGLVISITKSSLLEKKESQIMQEILFIRQAAETGLQKLIVGNKFDKKDLLSTKKVWNQMLSSPANKKISKCINQSGGWENNCNNIYFDVKRKICLKITIQKRINKTSTGKQIFIALIEAFSLQTKVEIKSIFTAYKVGNSIFIKLIQTI